MIATTPFGRTGHDSTRVIFGAAAFGASAFAASGFLPPQAGMAAGELVKAKPTSPASATASASRSSSRWPT